MKKITGKGQVAMGIAAFMIAIVIMIAAGITIFTDLGVTQQKVQTVDVEQLTNTQFNQTMSLANQKVVEGSETIVNSTALDPSVNISTLRKDSEYSISYRTGKVTFINRTGMWNVSYRYKPSGYAEKGTTRTILGLLPLLLAIGILVFASRYIRGKQ